jgi:hypothetical protein
MNILTAGNALNQSQYLNIQTIIWYCKMIVTWCCTMVLLSRTINQSGVQIRACKEIIFAHSKWTHMVFCPFTMDLPLVVCHSAIAKQRIKHVCLGLAQPTQQVLDIHSS